MIYNKQDILQCLGTTLSEFFSEEDSHVQKVFGPEWRSRSDCMV